MLLGIALVAAAAASCSGPPASGAPDRALSESESSRVSVGNFARVDDGVFRGAQPDRAGFASLREFGIRTVVNLRDFHSDRVSRSAAGQAPEGLDLVEIEMDALVDSDPPSRRDVERFFEVVSDPARRPVFIHCAHGKDRTGTMCALYRIEIQGWTPERAFDEMQAFGFHDIYVDLKRFVLGYEPRGFARR